MRGTLVDAIAAALAGGDHTLEDRAAGGVDFADVELAGIHAEVVLSVGDSALEQLDEGFGRSLGGLHQNRHGRADILAADQIADDLDLARRDA